MDARVGILIPDCACSTGHDVAISPGIALDELGRVIVWPVEQAYGDMSGDTGVPVHTVPLAGRDF